MSNGTLTANGQSVVFRADHQSKLPIRLIANGTWGGATLTISEQGENGTYYALESGALTSNSSKSIDPIYKRCYKAELSNAGTTSIYVEFKQGGLRQ